VLRKLKDKFEKWFFDLNYKKSKPYVKFMISEIVENHKKDDGIWLYPYNPKKKFGQVVEILPTFSKPHEASITWKRVGFFKIGLKIVVKIVNRKGFTKIIEPKFTDRKKFYDFIQECKLIADASEDLPRSDQTGHYFKGDFGIRTANMSPERIARFHDIENGAINPLEYAEYLDKKFKKINKNVYRVIIKKHNFKGIR